MTADADVPQPLKYVADIIKDPTHTVRFGPDEIPQRPDVAVLMVQVIAAWTHLEAQLALSLARTMNTQPDMGVEVYLSLEHNSAQLKVVRETAALALDEGDLAIFDAILALVRRCGRERNVVAHGAWGVSNKILDGFVLLPSKDMSRLTAPALVVGAFKPEAALANRKFIDRAAENIMVVLNNSQVYRDRDFRNTLDLIKATGGFLSDFWLMRQKEVGSERDQLRRKLCDAPAIQEVLFRQ